jgi:hypothetical protein
VVDIMSPDLCVDLSRSECWRLYVLLGEDAPFVRSQLSAVRNGRGGGISLSTPEERRHVLAALTAGSRGTNTLSTGLRLLHTALGESESALPARAATLH